MRSAVDPLTSLEKINLAFAMTWAAGFVDLVGFVSLYGLYTSHMTGNTVGMARQISLLDWPGVVRHGWPIATFVFGLMLGAFIYEAEKRRSIQVPFPPAILLEAILLGIFIAAATGTNFKADIPPQPAAKFFLMVALLAVPMGIQNVVIRKVGGINVYTTFVTGSLVKFAESLSEYLFWLRDRTRGRFRVANFQGPARDAAAGYRAACRADVRAVGYLPDRRGVRRLCSTAMEAVGDACAVHAAGVGSTLRHVPPAGAAIKKRVVKR